MNNKILHLAEKALEINRTFPEGVHAKQGMQPTGFLPPNKRVEIIAILEEIAKLSKTIIDFDQKVNFIHVNENCPMLPPDHKLI